MFKIFFETKFGESKDGSTPLALHGSFAMNGEELLGILPDELHDAIIFTAWESQDVNNFFNRDNIIYLVAQKIKDVTGLTEDEKRKELDEVCGSNFFD